MLDVTTGDVRVIIQHGKKEIELTWYVQEPPLNSFPKPLRDGTRETEEPEREVSGLNTYLPRKQTVSITRRMRLAERDGYPYDNQPGPLAWRDEITPNPENG